MASNFAIPFVLRETCRQIEHLLDLHLGVPMNAKLPKEVRGVTGVTIHWPGLHVKAEVELYEHHWGLGIEIKELVVTRSFWCETAATEWFDGLQKFAGPIESEWTSPYDSEGKLRFTIEGLPLDRLGLNASNRRNQFPVYEWDDPNHPFVRQ